MLAAPGQDLERWNDCQDLVGCTVVSTVVSGECGFSAVDSIDCRFSLVDSAITSWSIICRYFENGN